MLTQPKQKTILWVSKEAPPKMLGANFDAYASGKEAANKWRANSYVVAMVDTGVLNDGLTGFDVTRNIRASNPKATIYMMGATLNGPESILAQRMRVNGFVRRGFNDVQKALREANAINWADRPGAQTSATANASLGQRILSIFKAPDKAKSLETPATSAKPTIRSIPTSTSSVDDMLSDLNSLNVAHSEEVPAMTTADFIATAGLAHMDSEREAPRTIMQYHPKNPHDIKLQNFTKLGNDFEELDRQFAWELYTELSTRVAVTGKANDPTCVNIEGELWFESFASLLAFCKELRLLLRNFPAQRSKGQPHLGNMLLDITRIVINPFLDKWRVDYLNWWDYSSDKSIPPMQRQNEYPRSQAMLVEWRELKMTMRAVQDTVFKVYKL